MLKKEYGYEIPIVMLHILRQTFCISMANNKMSANNLQYIMEHANVNMALGYYFHGCLESVSEEIKLLSICW